MVSLLAVVLAVAAQAPPAPVSVSALKAGSPTTVAELDYGKLKGEPRRLSWAADGSELYLQVVEGKPPDEKVRHYIVKVEGGTVRPVDKEPAWAVEYWNVKQDRAAPGLPHVMIEINQAVETLKSGTGPAGVLDRQSSPEAVGSANPSVESLANGQHGNSLANVVRLSLAGEEFAAWINERPFPGGRFSWGPAGSGALVYSDEQGRLVFLDRERHRQQVPATKATFLPAWSRDGARLAYVVKTARKRGQIAVLPIGR
jgi:hypothetical protein